MQEICKFLQEEAVFKKNVSEYRLYSLWINNYIDSAPI